MARPRSGLGLLAACVALSISVAGAPAGAHPTRTPPSPDHLSTLIDRAAADDADALAKLGTWYVHGYEVEQDVPKGLSLLKRGMERHGTLAAAIFGVMLVTGDAVPANVEHGLQLLRAAAARNDAFAADQLSAIYRRGTEAPHDPAAALAWLRRAAELGDVEAQNRLGWTLLFGADGAAVDTAEGLTWVMKAAQRTEPRAQTTLGDCYEKGRGVPRDLALARYWYNEAAEQDFSIALLSLGELSEKGLGGPVDLAAARAFYQRAADLGEERGALRLDALDGNRSAQARLGDLLYDGVNSSGEDRDRAEAVLWFERAARQGDPHALDRLREIEREKTDGSVMAAHGAQARSPE